MTESKILAAMIVIFGLCGCASSGNHSSNTVDSPKSQSSFAGLFGTPTGPQYHWNGQTSTGTFDLSLEATMQKASRVLESMHFVITPDHTTNQGDRGLIQATREALSVTLNFTAKTPTATEVEVKIGVVGDRTGSERVLEQIGKVKEAPPKTQKIQ